MAEIVRMPKLSDTMTEGVVAEWHKNVGDQVESGEVLAEIETDKATMEFESFQDGVLLHIGVDKGATAAVDSILAILGEAYSVVRANQDEEKEKEVKTKKRSFVQYLKLVRAVFKARMAQRRALRAGGKAKGEGAKPGRRKGGFSFSSLKRKKKGATKEVTFATSSTTDSALNATHQV